MKTLRIPATEDALARANEFFTSLARDKGLSDALLMRVELVVEEMVLNQMKNAYPHGSGDLELSCPAICKGRFCMEFVDWGEPFDPLTHPTPDLDAPLEDRQIGGLGIHLVRNMAKEMCYERKDDRNVLRVCLEERS